MIEYSDYIKDFYKELELKSNLENFDYKKLRDSSLSQDDKYILQKEYWLLSDFATNCDNIHNKDEIIKYGEERLKTTSNIYLLSRYNHALYNLTKNSLYCKNAINNYCQVFKQYISTNICGYEIHLVLDWIIKLSKRIRLDMSSLEDTILSYLKTTGIKDDIKHWLLVSIKDNYDKWKPKNLEFTPQLCLELYSRENEYSKCKHILETGEFFALRLNKNLLKIIYEYLGDNEERIVYNYDGQPENMVVPHYNQSTYQRMMQYYQKACNEEKLRYATSKYNENKVGMRFFKIEEKRELPKEFAEFMEQLFKSIKEFEPIYILYFLSTHNELFYLTNSKLEELWEETERNKPFHMCHMNAVRCDINNNVRTVSHEELFKFNWYTTYLSNSIKWLINIFSIAVENKKLSYNIVKGILIKQTEFGRIWTITRNEQEYNFCWFDKIDFALKDFFEQYNKELKGKHADWRNVINTLTIQFEGILRDSIRVYNGETSKIVGSNKENIAEMLLDDLLRTEACKDLYTDEDRNLFYYIFTNKGYNIRNDVAHGFYLPHDYTSYKAILVFLCVLRLVRYN